VPTKPRSQPFTEWDAVPLILTVSQAREILTVSRETIYALIRTGELRTRKIGRRRVIPKVALREFLDAEGSSGS
jgi:excisionase family DNA binding protein